MSRHSKETVIKPKTLIYTLVAVIAITAIIVLTIFLINKIKNPPNGATNSTNNSQSNSVGQGEQTNEDSSAPNSQKPVIHGVENGKIYYTTQYITIEDNNIKSVTVNGEEYNTDFFLEGNADNMYVIEATDQDNNVTSYIVYTKTIKSLIDTISTFNQYTVTTDNLEDILLVRDAALNTGTKYSPPEETKELDNIIAICEKLLNKINEVQQKIDRITKDYENPEILEEIKNNTSKLVAAITDIDELLASNNITQEQRLQLTTIRAKYNNWLLDATTVE